MDDLIKVNNDIVSQESEDVEVLYGKVLNIRSSTPNIDFRGIVNKVCQFVDMADVLSKVKKGAEYVVQIPAEFQGGFDAGDYWIMENSKTGKLWPTLMEMGEDGRNKIVTPLAVKKQEFMQGNPARDITSNYHNLYMQQQMNEIAGLVESTLQTVQRIEHGQMDDRIGLLDAGRQGVLLALAQKDEASRSTAMLNAVNNINVAQNQIFKTFERRVTEFEPLPKTKFGQFLREMTSTGSYLDKRDNEYDEIPSTGKVFIDIDDKIKLEYASLTESFNGAITLEKKSIDLIPTGSLKPKKPNKKKDTLQSIIDKVNERFDGNFTDSDRVIIEGIYQMFMNDADVKKFKKYAKDNNPEMFVNSLFPDKFKDIVTRCFLENNDSFQKLFNDPDFYQKVMDAMAKELYKSLRKD